MTKKSMVQHYEHYTYNVGNTEVLASSGFTDWVFSK